MSQRVYIGLENIALTAPQRAQLISALAALGPAADPRPCNRNHRRVRLDNDAVIVEAAFGDTDLGVAALKGYLAGVFSVSASLITSANTSQSFGGGTTTIVTLAYQSTNRLRFALFGGVGCTYAQSLAEVLGYLHTNAAAWGDV